MGEDSRTTTDANFGRVDTRSNTHTIYLKKMLKRKRGFCLRDSGG